jgi:hypothetical protein
LSKKVLTLINQVAHGNIGDFSRTTGVSQEILRKCINQRHILSINLILKICYSLNLSFPEFAITSSTIPAIPENTFKNEVSLRLDSQEKSGFKLK